MSADTQLFDMNDKKWRSFQRGDSWRSLQVYQCMVCHCKTNLWSMGGYPNLGRRMSCPGTKFFEHKDLEKMLDRIEDFKENIKLIRNTINPYHRSIHERKATLLNINYDMIEVLEWNIKDLRNRFSKYDDLEGNVGNEVIELNTSSYYFAKEHLP